MSHPDLKVSVISDVHVTHYGEGKAEFERALQFHTEKLPASDLYLFPGDIIYQVDSSTEGVCHHIYESNYDAMLELVQTYIPDIPKLFVVGNHEFPQNNTDPALTEEAMEVWNAKIKQHALEHVILNEYHFIKAPLISWAMEASESNEVWLKNELEIALSDGNKPVFLITHVPVHQTVGTSSNQRSFTDDFRKFLTKNPRIIHISGHTHNHILDEKSIYQEGFTSVNAPVCAVGYLCWEGCSYREPTVFAFSQSLFLEVWERVVKVHRIDLVSGKEVGEPWIIDLDETEQGIYRYGAMRTTTEKRPEFSRDAVVSVCATDNHVLATVAQTFQSNDVVVQYYLCRVTDGTGKEVLQAVKPSDFYNLSQGKSYADTLTFSLGELKKGAYTLHVTPANCFLQGGEHAISCSFTVK